jgi:TRAP-type C4-dicarboxylate transport system permease small subunit
MMLLNIFKRGFDRLEEALGYLSGAILAFTMVVVAVDVVARFLLNNPIAWATETSEYALLFLTFFGASWVLRKEGHVRMDIVISSLREKPKAILNTITAAIGAFLWLIIAIFAAKAAWESFELGYVFYTPLRTPKYIVLGVIPVGSFWLFVRSLIIIFKHSDQK